MEPRATGQFIDDFYGTNWVQERYQDTVSNGYAEIAYDFEGSHGGVLAVVSEDAINNYAKIATASPVQWSRGKRATVRARFSVSALTDAQYQIGLMNDATHYVALDFTTASSSKWRLRAVNGAADNVAASSADADANWHTLELRMLGTGLGAELVLDGAEAAKLTLADGVLPTGRLYLFAYTKTTANLGGGATRELWIDYWAAMQSRLA